MDFATFSRRLRTHTTSQTSILGKKEIISAFRDDNKINNNKDIPMEKLTRAQRKNLKKQAKLNGSKPSLANHGSNSISRRDNTNPGVNFKLKHFTPKTKNQETIFRKFSDGQHLLLHGMPGTGKSFVALYLALNEIEQFKTYRQVILIRSAVPSRDQGFLPGTVKEKAAMYELPYIGICSELYGRGDAYSILNNKNMIDFQTSSFMRGLTFNDAVIIVDECQNMSAQELNSIITRVGENSRLILCGDMGQNDLVQKKYDMSGLIETMHILRRMPSVSMIELTVDDIIRSGFVKEYIIAKHVNDEVVLTNGLSVRPRQATPL
jgi:phosphate starvation-inducible protein PhoH and related proteins